MQIPFRPSSRGQTVMEYLLLTSVVAFMVFVAFTKGNFISKVFTTTQGQFNAVSQVIAGDDPKPIAGGWCEWTPCLQGVTMQYRTCECPAPAFDGAQCQPDASGGSARSCSGGANPCLGVNCDDFNSCTVDTCSGGVCSNANMPVNGGWSWSCSTCDASCNQSCFGTCNNPSPSCGGTCAGPSTKTQSCTGGFCASACDNDGVCEVGEDCTVCPGDCGCNDGNSCTNDICSTGICAHVPSPRVNGGWSWSPWGACEASCKQFRAALACNNPAPSCGGSFCPGVTIQSRSCTGGACGGSCTPNCTGAVNCGDSDGCGGRCPGACPGTDVCDASNTCVPTCNPDCSAAINCGDSDGCGGSCSGACSGTDSCENGSCVATGDGACNAGNEGQFNVCGDKNACTNNHQCVGGKCTAGDPVVCDSKNPCIVDSCDHDLGCQQTFIGSVVCGGSCCSGTDVCNAGNVCGPAPDCVTDADCGPGEFCDAGTCSLIAS